MNRIWCPLPAVEHDNDEQAARSPRRSSVPINEGRRLRTHRYDHDKIESILAQRRQARFGLGVPIPILSGALGDAPPGKTGTAQHVFDSVNRRPEEEATG